MNTMKLSDMAKKLLYQREVNTGYSEGFLGRIEHKPLKTYATTKQNRYNSGVDGLDLNFDDFEDTDEIIDKVQDDVFRNVSLVFDNQELITDDLKHQFLVRYWNMRLGQPTQQQFLMTLRYYFKTEMKNLLIQNYLLSTIKIEDLLDGGKNNSTSNAVNHQGNSTRPDNEVLEYETAKNVLMTRANAYAKTVGNSDNESYQTYGKYGAFIASERFSNEEIILTGARKLFLLTMNA